MASKEFSQTLKELRIRAQYTQKQVYEHFNIPQSTFSSWEVGKSEPSGDMLIKLCNFYRCDMMKEFSKGDILTYAELNILEKYRDLDTHGREMVDFTLLKEWERSSKSDGNHNKFVEIPKYSTLNAAHARTDIEITDEMKQHDDDIMDDKNF